MKKLAILGASIVLMVGLSGCSTELTPSETVECFLDGITTENSEFVENTYGNLDIDAEINKDPVIRQLTADAEVSEIIDKNIHNVSYEINGEETDGGEAYVTANLVYRDYGKLIREESEDYLNGLVSLEGVTKDTAKARCTDILKAGSVPTSTDKVKISLAKEGNKWVVKPLSENKELTNALTCNIANGVSAVMRSFDNKKVAEANKQKKEEKKKEEEKAEKEKQKAEEKRRREAEEREQAERNKPKPKKKKVSSPTFTGDTLKTAGAEVALTRWQTRKVENGRAFIINFRFTNKSNKRQSPETIWKKYFRCSLGHKLKIEGLKNVSIGKGQSIDYAVGYEYDDGEVVLKVVSNGEQLGSKTFR